MALEVLLRRTIDGVGDVGEIVKVKPGFARNYLLPHGYAALVTPEALRRVVKDKAVEAVRQARLAEERAGVAAKLADLTLTIEARAGEDGHLYGSVGPRQILSALADRGFRFVERNLRFEVVRELGQYQATILLSPEHHVEVPVWVVQDAGDALSMAEEAARRASQEAAAAEEEALPSIDTLEA